jgi:hypothetical protein
VGTTGDGTAVAHDVAGRERGELESAELQVEAAAGQALFEEGSLSEDARHARERARPSSAAVRRATATLFRQRAPHVSRLSSPLLARAQQGVHDAGERFRRIAVHRHLRAVEAACIVEGAL